MGVFSKAPIHKMCQVLRLLHKFFRPYTLAFGVFLERSSLGKINLLISHVDKGLDEIVPQSWKSIALASSLAIQSTIRRTVAMQCGTANISLLGQWLTILGTQEYHTKLGTIKYCGPQNYAI